MSGTAGSGDDLSPSTGAAPQEGEEQVQPTLSVTAGADTNLGVSHPDDGVAVTLDTGGPPGEQTTIHVSDPSDDIDYSGMPDDIGVPLASDSKVQVDTGPDDSIDPVFAADGPTHLTSTTGDRIQVTTGEDDIPLTIDPDEDRDQDQDADPATEAETNRHGGTATGSRDTGQGSGDDSTEQSVSPQMNGHDNPLDYLPPGDGRPIDDDERDGGRGTDHTRDRS